MNTPVFVIHGIANRDEDEFAQRVARLAHRVGRPDDVHPVFWGDLGADQTRVAAVVPPAPARRGPRLRDGGAPGFADDDLPGLDGVGDLDPAGRSDVLAEGARSSLETVDTLPPGVADEAADAVRNAWESEELPYLWNVGDPVLLAEIGAAVGRSVAEQAAADAEAGYELRVGGISAVVGAALRQADRVAAATASTAAARLNTWVRMQAGPAVAQNLGDLLVYQRHRDLIHARVRERILAVAGDRAGREGGRPVHLVGHSLGAVIAMDVVTAVVDPVYTDSIVTFGSIWPLLHLWHPTGVVPRFEGSPVPLPSTVRRWVNLWEPLDPMAFLARPVFVLQDGSRPADRELLRGAAATLFTHSAYWESPELRSELDAAWRHSGP